MSASRRKSIIELPAVAKSASFKTQFVQDCIQENRIQAAAHEYLRTLPYNTYSAAS